MFQWRSCGVVFVIESANAFCGILSTVIVNERGRDGACFALKHAIVVAKAS